MASCPKGHRAALQELLIDDHGETWVATAEEISTWVRSFRPCHDGNDILEILKLGFIHVWPLPQWAIVSLWPELVNPVTMTGAIHEIATLDKEWTFIWDRSPGGQCERFAGYMSAIIRIEALMAAAGKVEAYSEYAGLKEAAARFSQTELLSDC